MNTKPPTYVGIDKAREILAQMGIYLTRRQMQRAAEVNKSGKRKLPFFIDPIDKKLKIEKGDLVRVYREAQINAHKNLRD